MIVCLKLEKFIGFDPVIIGHNLVEVHTSNSMLRCIEYMYP